MVGFALNFDLYLLFLQMEQFLLVQTLSSILSWPEVVLPKFFSLSFHQLRSTKIVITMIIIMITIITVNIIPTIIMIIMIAVIVIMHCHASRVSLLNFQRQCSGSLIL